MYFAKYLLSIEEFRDTEKGRVLVERAFSRVDETRRRKAEGMRPGQPQMVCLGAGLLLQLAVREALDRNVGKEEEDRERAGREGADREGKSVSGEDEKTIKIKQYSAIQLLTCVERTPRASLSYTYGEKGKPYFKDLPFYFNLSHSGDYVLCGLSTEEIGADIQQHCGKDVGKLARRFFSRREAAVLEQAGAAREKLFYKLWARKEAYGKLTGRGVADILDVDLLPGGGRNLEKGNGFGDGYMLPSREAVLPVGRAALSQATVLPDGRCLIWEEWDAEGYSIAFCRYGQGKTGTMAVLATSALFGI